MGGRWTDDDDTHERLSFSQTARTLQARIPWPRPTRDGTLRPLPEWACEFAHDAKLMWNEAAARLKKREQQEQQDIALEREAHTQRVEIRKECTDVSKVA